MYFLVLVLLLVNFITTSSAEEYSFVNLKNGYKPVNLYFSSKGIPDIHISTKCSEDGKICWQYLENSTGKKITANYNTKYNSLSIESKLRYKNNVYALIHHTYKSEDTHYEKYFLIDFVGKKTYFKPEFFYSYLGTKPLKNKNILIIRRNEILEASPKKIVFKTKIPSIENVFIGNNLNGDISAVGYYKNDLVFITYRKQKTKWIIHKNALATHGDRKGILSIYPENENISYSAIYKYVNPYNKGIVLYKIDFKNNKVVKGFLFNSQRQNIGFDPSIYVDKDKIIVSAKNSTKQTYNYFEIPKNQIKKIQYVKIQHIKGFEKEKNLEFLISGRISTLSWIAYQTVEKDNIDYSKVSYDLSNSIFYGASIQGRKGDIQIAITYLKNKAEKKGGLAAKTSQILTAVIDFNRILSNQQVLRIGFEQGKINGIATYEDKIKNTKQNQVFQTNLKTFYGTLLMERGFAFGIEYIDYLMPSAIGFSNNSGSIVYYDFDKNFKLKSLLITIGYDHIYYAKRYETNYKGFYGTQNFGIGLGFASISNEVKQNAKTQTGISELQTPLYIILKGYGEYGYLYQFRIKKFAGLGFSFNTGIRLTLFWSGSGNENDDSEKEKLHLEFSRFDVLYGLFCQLNIIF